MNTTKPWTVRVPQDWYQALKNHLARRMTPERWLGNLIREWNEASCAMLPEAPARAKTATTSRIVATVPRDFYFAPSRFRERSAAAVLWRLCYSKFNPLMTRPPKLPKDQMVQIHVKGVKGKKKP
jgi:hypothetical protein